ncbi:MAG: energy-coupling factor transporter ATPase [Bacilli bacterium]|nr:energy-coupling factor transporter ATPase [Bacilli bacterium]
MSVKFSKVFFTYSPKSPFEYEALRDINLDLESGKFIALVGKTGSGKSTLVQHINSLIHPTSGIVDIDGFINSGVKKERTKDIKGLRKHVGLVFQFPEYQLFEETVERDVAFGPKNVGMKEAGAIEKAHWALEKVGLGKSFFERSPFELSGGEKRKVAIAGILAMEPKILVVDEPTAGLDPAAAKDTMSLFKKINEEGTTVILVTHDMDLVASYCDEVVVMENGKVEAQCSPSKLFGRDLSEYSLQNPHIFDFALRLKKRGIDLDMSSIRTTEDLAKAIAKRCKHG